MIWIIFMFERIQPRQLSFGVPSKWPFIAVAIVDIDFDIAGCGAARQHKDTTNVATYLRSDGTEGAILEADVEESGIRGVDR